LVFVVASAAALILSTVAFAQTAQYGMAEEARVMLEKAVAAVKADKTKALDIFSEGGFKDRDLYVFCANASDSVQTAHPTGLGARLKDFKDVKGFAFGEEIMRTATEGAVNEVIYLWPALAPIPLSGRSCFSRRSGTRFVASATTSELRSRIFSKR
jgi:hypothetical protein